MANSPELSKQEVNEEKQKQIEADFAQMKKQAETDEEWKAARDQREKERMERMGAGAAPPEEISASTDEPDQETKRVSVATLKRRITLAKKEIAQLNKRVQESYKTENYTVKNKTLGTVDPDVEKQVAEKEAEIKKWEDALRAATLQQEKEAADATKKKRIADLKEEIARLNKRVQESYKTENYTVKNKTLGTVDPDVEKQVAEKEAEIRRLEDEMRGTARPDGTPGNGGAGSEDPKPGSNEPAPSPGPNEPAPSPRQGEPKTSEPGAPQPEPQPGEQRPGPDEGKKEEINNRLNEAKSFNDLYNILESMDVIEGSQEDFTPEQVISFVNAAQNKGRELGLGRDRKYDDLSEDERKSLDDLLLQITNTHYKIRDKVKELLGIVENGQPVSPENPALTEKTPEELEQMRMEVERLRKEYLEVDYKKNTGYKRVGKVLGRLFQDKREKLRENDGDIAWYRAHYDDKLMDYRNALLEDWKAKGSSPERLAEIAKIFETEAQTNMADGHTQVKLEHHEGRFSGFIRDHSKELVDRYNKMSLKKKIAIGAAFGLGALGAGMTGSAIAIGVVASAATMRRAFMSMVTGTSAALWAENKTRKNWEKGIEKNTAALTSQFEGKTPEEMRQLAQDRINGLIFDADNKINNIKNKNLRNLGVGIGAGAAMLAVPGFLKHGKDWIAHLHSNVKPWGGMLEHFQHQGHIKPWGGMLEPHQAATHAAAVPHPAEHMATHHAAANLQHAHEAAKNIELNVNKGSSFEGAIIKHLEANGIKPHEAGRRAHLMYLDYIKNHPDPTGHGYNLVYPGAKLTLTPDGKHIFSFHDSLTKGAHHAAHHAAEAAKTHAARNVHNARHSVPPPSRDFGAAHHASARPGAGNAAPGLRQTWGPAPTEYAAAGPPPVEFVPGYAAAPPSWFEPHYIFHPVHHFHDWPEYHGFVREAHRFGFGPHDDPAGRGLHIMKGMVNGNHGKWTKMQNLSVREARNQMGARVRNRIDGLINWHKQLVGPEANPRSNEPVAHWVRRMARLSARRGRF